jgi:hypothetical protein
VLSLEVSQLSGSENLYCYKGLKDMFQKLISPFLFYQIWTPWKRISEQCGEDDASRRRNFWNIYGYWNRH